MLGICSRPGLPAYPEANEVAPLRLGLSQATQLIQFIEQ